MEGNVWIVSLTIMLIITLIIFYIWIQLRNNKVYAFRLRMIDLLFDQPDTSLIKMYKNGPTYNQMLYSFRPLKLENWYDKELLKNLFK